jgi:hypothetical protein
MTQSWRVVFSRLTQQHQQRNTLRQQQQRLQVQRVLTAQRQILPSTFLAVQMVA